MLVCCIVRLRRGSLVVPSNAVKRCAIPQTFLCFFFGKFPLRFLVLRAIVVEEFRLNVLDQDHPFDWRMVPSNQSRASSRRSLSGSDHPDSRTIAGCLRGQILTNASAAFFVAMLIFGYLKPVNARRMSVYRQIASNSYGNYAFRRAHLKILLS